MKKIPLRIAALCSALALCTCASATVLTMNLGTGINGTTPYATDKTPWLSASFTDLGVKNGVNVVQLVMTNNLVNAATSLSTGEYVSDWLFNIDPAFTSFNVSYVSGYQASVSVAQTIGSNAIKGGVFDIDFIGATNSADRFTGGMKSVYEFSAAGLTAGAFAFTSNAGYYSAADIRGIGNGLSGSIGATTAVTTTGTTTPAQTAIPEPVSIALVGLGAGAMFLANRRRKNKNKQA